MLEVQSCFGTNGVGDCLELGFRLRGATLRLELQPKMGHEANIALNLGF